MSPEQLVEPNILSGDINDVQSQDEMSEPEGLGSGYLQQFPEPEPEPYDFHENIAKRLTEQQLNDIAGQLIDDIENDLSARSDWEKTINLGFKYLGFKVEENKQTPFINACGAYDTALAQSLISAYSVFRAELFPAEGPAAVRVLGVETKEKQDRAERVEIFTNHFLTKIDKSYYPDSEQLIMYNIFCGSAFRKVYPDPITRRPTARFVKPQDFIVNPDTTDLLNSVRMTEVLYYTRSEVINLEKSGFYKPGSLPPKDSDSDPDESQLNSTISKIDGLDKSDKKTMVRYYECHVELDPREVEPYLYDGVFDKDKDESYRPYIVTLCAEDESQNKIAAIRRGWVENSEDYKKEIYFISYYYIKGFGIYGMGLAHLMGSNAIVLTMTLRQTVDAGTLKNFPGFLVAKGLRLEKNDLNIGPGEAKEVDTASMPIQQVIMPMPYGEPSQALIQLNEKLREQTLAIPGAAQAQIPELGSNAPVGTTLALLETTNRVMATVLRSFHTSLGNELELLYKLLGKYLPDGPYPFMVPGKETAVMRSDFSDDINIIPVSDPNYLMRTHRIMQADALVKHAEAHPELHNMYEVQKRFYQTLNVENVDAILPPPAKPQALDAISENMQLMSGKGAIASMQQDHDAHIFLHMNAANQMMQMQNIPGYTQAMAHIQVHKAFKTLNQPQLQQNPQINQMLGQSQEWMENPQILLTIPDIQRQIDIQDAQEEHQKQEMMAQQAANQPQPIDPTVAVIEEIKQKDRASELHLQETKMKLETDMYKANTNIELEKEKIRAQILIEQMKHGAQLDLENERALQRELSESRQQEASERQRILDQIEGDNQ